MTTSLNGVPAGPFIIYTGSFTIPANSSWDANSIRYLTQSGYEYTYLSTQFEKDGISSSRFTSPPTVFANVTSGAGTTTTLMAKVIGVNKDYANISVLNCGAMVTTTAAITINWMAIGT